MTSSNSLAADRFLARFGGDMQTGPWHQMRLRFKPLLGDIADPLGDSWHAALDQLFTETDLSVADAMRARRRPSTSRYVLDRRSTEDKWHEEPGPLVADGVEVLIAHFLDSCRSTGRWPDELLFNPTEGTFEVSSAGRVVADVRPLKVQQSESDVRDRAAATVLGLREMGSPNSHLQKRAARWPGMSFLKHGKEEIENLQRYPELRSQAHLSVPKEWLLSATFLCRLCGHRDPGQALIESVAAAAFNFESWNHLSGAFKKHDVFDAWYVDEASEARYAPGASTVVGYFANPFDAVATLLLRGPDFARGREANVELESHSGMSGDTPFYSLCWKVPVAQYKDHPEGPFILIDEESLAAHPIPSADARDETIELVRQKVSEGEAALRSLFRVNSTPSEKIQLAMRTNNESELVVDGGWHFSVTDTSLILRRFDEAGNTVEQFFAARHKSELRAWGEYTVLCNDWSGRRPIVLLEGLSDDAIACIAEAIPASLSSFEYFGVFAPVDAERNSHQLERLLEKARARRDHVQDADAADADDASGPK